MIICILFQLTKHALTVTFVQIIEIKPLELRVKFGIGFHGRVHITEVKFMKCFCHHL